MLQKSSPSAAQTAPEGSVQHLLTLPQPPFHSFFMCITYLAIKFQYYPTEVPYTLEIFKPHPPRRHYDRNAWMEIEDGVTLSFLVAYDRGSHHMPQQSRKGT